MFTYEQHWYVLTLSIGIKNKKMYKTFLFKFSRTFDF